MADIKLFKMENNSVKELQGRTVAIEKSLQILLENHLEEFLGVRYLATEYLTGKTHGGRIDTLGLDDNNSPVIIEYKKAFNENVINQGLFYLDWLMDHKADFTLLVMKKLGSAVAEEIDWRTPRLLCIAGDFKRYDEYAVQQIPREIQLLRYRRYDEDLLLLELVSGGPSLSLEPKSAELGQIEEIQSSSVKSAYLGFADLLPTCSTRLQDLWASLQAFLLALGDDVQMKSTKYYMAFRRLKNFASVEVHPRADFIAVFLKIDPSTVLLREGYTRDVSKIGHYGTGDLEVRIRSEDDFEDAKRLILQSYGAS